MKNFLTQYNDLWCEFMHRDTMWPIHGEYKCRECLRTRSVPWANQARTSVEELAPAR